MKDGISSFFYLRITLVLGLDQQRVIAEMLWATNAAIETNRALKANLLQCLRSQVDEAMNSHVFSEKGNKITSVLGDLFEERRESGFGDLPVLSVTIKGTVVPRDSLERNVIDKTGTEKYFRVCPGDIAYNTMRMWQGSCGVVNAEGIISPAYTVLTPRRDKANSMFWNYAFHTPEMMDWFRRYSTGVAADRWRLYYKSFSRIRIRIPALALQTQFVEAFIRTESAASKAQANSEQLSNVMQSAVNALTSGVQMENP